jgi:hypothetical protein
MAMATEAQRRSNRAYKARNKEKVKAAKRTWFHRYGDRCRATHRKHMGLPDPTRPTPAACECCGKPCRFGALCLDHDHRTGEFRGWLCRTCNSGLGLLGDSLPSVLCAVDYLMRAVK